MLKLLSHICVFGRTMALRMVNVDSPSQKSPFTKCTAARVHSGLSLNPEDGPYYLLLSAPERPRLTLIELGMLLFLKEKCITASEKLENASKNLFEELSRWQAEKSNCRSRLLTA